MDKKVLWFLILVVVAGLLNLGTIRRKKNAILDTQTPGIAYKEKMEEIKDGVKGAPTPSFQFQGKAQFLTESPMETFKESAAKPEDAAEGAAIENEIWDEDQESGQAEEEAQSAEPAGDVEDEDWWLEDSEGQESQAGPAKSR